jgi:glucose-1-phosphate thymidylyltransferase
MGFRELPNGSKKPKVVSHYLLEKYKEGGADRSFFILKPGKWDIPAYYLNGQMLEMPLAYLTMDLPYGVPYTIDQAYPFVKEDVIMLGFPDIIFQDKTVFKQKITALQNWQVDVVLGLFPVADAAQAAKCDVVDWDENKNEIEEIVIKSLDTPFRKCWLTAAWSPAFTAFMHTFLQQDLTARKANPALPELFMGHVLQAALKAGLKVKGIYFEKETYIDIGTPNDFMKAQRGYLTEGRVRNT